MIFGPYAYLLIPAILLTVWAQFKVKSTYRRYSQVGVRSGATGADVARRMMSVESINDVDLEQIPGEMTDHYDPRDRVVRLSQDVYHGHSIAALGIAAHEMGHVLQDAHGYAPMKLRGIIYPVSSVGSALAWPLVIIGIVLGGVGQAANPLGALALNAGIWLFTAAVAFTLITLPVEFNASSRAVRALSQSGIMTEEELSGARAVLNAAAMTYVAAAAVAIIELIRILLIARGRD